MPSLAPTAEALTFAQTLDKAGKTITLLVAEFDGETIDAIDITALGAPINVDVFDASAAVGNDQLRAALTNGESRSRYHLSELLPSGARMNRHVATGTNFAEHAMESGSEQVFNFPKFGMPTAARSTLIVQPGTLLDYEVEISVRFDRDIWTMADFEAARKGFFLCGDFTDRATLLTRIDHNDIWSGRGFSDAKSGPGYFPTGPFLVIPEDWRSFVRGERIVTCVNGTERQDVCGSAMILDFEAIVAKALADSHRRNYSYRNEPATLLDGEVIPRGAAVMSGTGEGVLFMPPMLEDKIGGVLDHILLGRFLQGKSLFASVVNRFIRNELIAGRYLHAGDRVEHLSSSMGTLMVELIAP